MAAEDTKDSEAADPSARPPRRHRRRRRRRGWKLIPITLIGLILVFAALAAAAALLSQGSLRSGVDELSKAIDAVHQGDRHAAVQDLNGATGDFARAHSVLTAWWTEPAVLVPGVSEQLNALRSVAGAGGEVCSAGLHVNEALTTEAVPHGQALIAMLRQLEPALTGAESSLAKAEAQLSGARSSLLLPPISSRLDEAVTKVSNATHEDQVAVAGVSAAVQFLGGDGPRSYFLAVQTEAESRASGGVIGNYGIVTADDGTLHLTRFGTAQSLESRGDVATRKLIAPADYVARYGQFEPASFWANVPMSPDFPTVAEVIEGLYPQEGGAPVNGVISVDPFALADLLQATGPIVVKAWPQPITADNAVAVLLHDQYDKLTGTPRTNFLGDVTKTVWHRFTDGDLPDLATLIRDLSPAFAHKDLLLASTSPATEGLLRQIGAAGAFSPPTNSDFLAITTQNSGENKIDWYLRRSIDYQLSYVPKTGAIIATVTVSLHNLAPTTGQPPYVIGWGGQQLTKTPGENHCYITIYTPWPFVGATIDGKVLLLAPNRELGVWADSAFVSIPPGGTTTISVLLTGHLRPGSPYRLTMSRQPMVAPDEVQVGVQLPAGDRFSNPSAGLSLTDEGREAAARFEFESNTSFSASVGG
ncbi:MAG: DUF4012 domain-containing protein [Acidimicrobiales bacterium]|jgi:hypothetical protein